MRNAECGMRKSFNAPPQARGGRNSDRLTPSRRHGWNPVGSVQLAVDHSSIQTTAFFVAEVGIRIV